MRSAEFKISKMSMLWYRNTSVEFRNRSVDFQNSQNAHSIVYKHRPLEAPGGHWGEAPRVDRFGRTADQLRL